MMQTHPHVNDINKLKSQINVYEDDELLFSGRSLTDEKDFQNTAADAPRYMAERA